MSDKTRTGGSRGDAVVCQDKPDAVEHAGGRGEVRPVSATAKSRRFLDVRLESSRAYAHFAAAAGADIFDGEPIERFAAVGKLDERTLRMRAQELREDIYADAMRARVAHRATRQVEG